VRIASDGSGGGLTAISARPLAAERARPFSGCGDSAPEIPCCGAADNLGAGECRRMMLKMGSRGESVRALQVHLNRVLVGETPPLQTDGIFGAKTRMRVLKYQMTMGLKPDGIVGPRTAAGIPGQAGMGGASGQAPIAPPPAASPAPASGVRFEPELRQVFEQQQAMSEWQMFIEAVEQGSIPPMKIFLGGIGRVEDARAVARFFINLRRWGLTAREIELLFEKISRFNSTQAKNFFDATTAPAGQFGNAIKRVADSAAKVGLFVVAIECIIHASRDNHSAIPAEIYKYVMGKGVRWAAVIDGIGSLLDGVVPEQTRKNSVLFQILRSLDPIGLGGAAVDSVCALIIGLFEMALRREVDLDVMIPRLSRLVDRLKKGPTAIFAEIGENCGDALYELSQMKDIDVQQMLRYTWAELKERLGRH
jgi:peptidoglycan hydrolase-like protein with peptidoglycan-binding domain